MRVLSSVAIVMVVAGAAWAEPAFERVDLVSDGSDEHDVYKGLAIATDRHGRTRLYATDFHNARVVVLDDAFNEVALGDDAFDDDWLPRGYAPFGIAAFGRRLFVTYALQNAE